MQACVHTSVQFDTYLRLCTYLQVYMQNACTYACACVSTPFPFCPSLFLFPLLFLCIYLSLLLPPPPSPPSVPPSLSLSLFCSPSLSLSLSLFFLSLSLSLSLSPPVFVWHVKQQFMLRLRVAGLCGGPRAAAAGVRAATKACWLLWPLDAAQAVLD